MEEWRPVLAFPLYEVSDLGRVRNSRTKKLLKSRPLGPGYPIVDLHTGRSFGLSDDVGQKTVTVHKLVCTTFHGPAPSPFHEVAHGDGNPSNPRADNLRWATRAENHADKKLHGTSNVGSRNGGAKLSAATVMMIAMSRETEAVLRDRYGVSQATIGKIRRGEKWGWLTKMTPHQFVQWLYASSPEADQITS